MSQVGEHPDSIDFSSVRNKAYGHARSNDCRPTPLSNPRICIEQLPPGQLHLPPKQSPEILSVKEKRHPQ